METIINFLEEYWGYTLFGGVSLGTIITFIITNIKTLIQNKNKNINIDNIISKTNDLVAELTNRDGVQKQKIEELNTRIRKQQNEMAERNAYFEKIQEATFSAISYLTMASKLPTEDKIALQKKFTNVLESKAVEYKEMLTDEVEAIKTEITSNIVPDAKATIKATVEETKSLLDKYMEE